MNRMTWVGLGQHMYQQDGCAILALHEGRTFLQQTFDGGPGGGIEELNMVAEHDVFKNSPANAGGKFFVRNPHLIALIMLHLEEIAQQASQPDTVAGMSRFLMCKFPAVHCKIRPSSDGEAVRGEIEEYFNLLGYDQVVASMAHVLCITKLLFPHNEARDDEAQSKTFSKVSGLHTLPFVAAVKEHFVSTFNEYVGRVRADQKVLGGESSRLNKEKTRALQFIAPLDCFEKAIRFLLLKQGNDVREESLTRMSGEDIIHSLASVRRLIGPVVGAHVRCHRA